MSVLTDGGQLCAAPMKETPDSARAEVRNLLDIVNDWADGDCCIAGEHTFEEVDALAYKLRDELMPLITAIREGLRTIDAYRDKFIKEIGYCEPVGEAGKDALIKALYLLTGESPVKY